MTRRTLAVLVLLCTSSGTAAAASSPPMAEHVVRYADSAGLMHAGVLTVPRSYSSGVRPALPLVLVPERGGDAIGWRELPSGTPFALLRLEGGPSRVGPEGIASLAEAPAAVRSLFPWLRLSPGRIYVFGRGEGGRRALRLAVARPQLLAGVAALDVFQADGFVPSGRQLAFSQVPVQLWAGSAAERQRQAGLARAIRSARAGGRVLETRGGWPSQLETALLGFGLLPLPGDATASPSRRPQAARACLRPASSSYPWPVRPFDRPHAVRGNVGDPRTRFRLAAPDDERADGSFTFHNGVDIVAPARTPVYPVVSGVAERAGRFGVVVRVDGGRSFEYQHIEPTIEPGAHVFAGRTSLGTVLARALHVHLTEFAPDGSVANPLLHLAPYVDATAPVVSSAEAPASARGRIRVFATASDEPSRFSGGAWDGLPVAPARIFLSLRRRDGATIRRARGTDFTAGLPANGAFRTVYAPGTRQNFAVVGFHYFAGTAGRYRYRLALDVRDVAPGTYMLVVNATDACGNAGSLTRPIRVLRDPSWRPPASPARSRSPGPAPPVRWPARGYTVVLASIPDRAGMHAVRVVISRARAAGLPRVGALESSRYAGVSPGYRVVFSGRYGTAVAALTASERTASRFPGAYPRLIGGKRPTPALRSRRSEGRR